MLWSPPAGTGADTGLELPGLEGSGWHSVAGSRTGSAWSGVGVTWFSTGAVWSCVAGCGAASGSTGVCAPDGEPSLMAGSECSTDASCLDAANRLVRCDHSDARCSMPSTGGGGKGTAPLSATALVAAGVPSAALPSPAAVSSTAGVDCVPTTPSLSSGDATLAVAAATVESRTLNGGGLALLSLLAAGCGSSPSHC